ncbi:MAG: HAMP domain-containing protein, partial [Cycloclasticus sp.]|nr:HAMP domain-containing protein [Cycloclasticus sp.]
MNNLMQLFKSTSALNGTNANFVEDMYEQYLNDPESIDEQWREQFNSIRSNADTVDIPHSSIKKHFADLAKAPTGVRVIQGGGSPAKLAKQAAVSRLMNAYRINGHKQANINPLHPKNSKLAAELDIAFHGLSELDHNTVFDTGTLHNTPEQLALKDILPILQETYCSSIGVEYMHISDTEMRSWVRRRMEGPRSKLELDTEQKTWLLKLLTAAEGIENHLHRTYVGQKRFSLEGGESLIPMLDEMLQRMGEHGVKETVIGMAHRGRLNVLVNIFGKNPSILFEEFEGKRSASPSKNGSGDVKYHMGFSSDINTPGGDMHLALAFNPSHLEIINPITVEGRTIGILYLKSDLSKIKAFLIAQIISAAIITTLMVFLILFLTRRLQRLISDPILNLTKVAQEVSQTQNYELRAQKETEDELGILADSFNEMMEVIRQHEFAMKQSERT